jgi:hypothetical protein
MATIAAIAQAAVSLGSTVMQFVGGQAATKAARNAAIQQQIQDHKYRQEVMQWQLDVWAQDLEYAREVLSYSREEFAKQTEWAQRALEAVDRNRNAETFTFMARAIEEGIAAAFQNTAIARQGLAARASLAARDRGVEGASVEAVLNDVKRQVGEAQTMTELNLQGTRRQLAREMLAADAASDQQMSAIASNIKTFAPNAPIRKPQPVGQPQAQQLFYSPNAGSLVSGIFNAITTGFNTYNALTGQNAKQTFNQLSSWVGRLFSFGSSSSQA